VPLGRILELRLAGIRGSRQVVVFRARLDGADMEVGRELLETGKVTPLVDRRCGRSEIADALRCLGKGHARGKVVLAV